MSDYRFLFRLDVSPSIGTGHLQRCLALAKELKKKGNYVFFICKSTDFNLKKYLDHVADDWINIDGKLTPEEDAYEVARYYKKLKIKTSIIDHYQANETYQQILYQTGVQWLQFDGSAKNHFWADWVLCANPVTNENVYRTLRKRPETQLLLGPKYALLRNEFLQWQPYAQFRECVQKVLISFGGGNDRGATLFCLKALQFLELNINIIVLLGSTNPSMAEIISWIRENKSTNIKLSIDEQNIARQMAETDLAIIAGGTTSFETAAMGIPVLIIPIADNQLPNATAWDQLGVAKDMGALDCLPPDVLRREVTSLINSPKRRKSMSNAGRASVDCLGTQRVTQTLLNKN